MDRRFVTKSELENTKIFVESMISSVRSDLRKQGWTFSHRLVGSAGRNLATKTVEGFDLDYVFEFSTTKNKNVNITKNIKQIVLQSIEKNKSKHSKVNDSTSSIHYFAKNDDGTIVIQSDIAIIINDLSIRKIVKGKGGNYFTEPLSNYLSAFEKFEKIKAENFNNFKEDYLKALKNKTQNQISFDVFIKTVENFKI